MCNKNRRIIPVHSHCESYFSATKTTQTSTYTSISSAPISVAVDVNSSESKHHITENV